ncbi:MAG: manganese efflux pump [Bacilli bacterium]|nr:manganese efflux pump [Bacilli bacterium]
MTWEIIVKIILFGIALAMDAFAVSITDGLIYSDINKKKIFFIAATFGIMQALMPVIGFFAVEIVSLIVGNSGSVQAIKVFTIVVTWLSFGLLILIGLKMLIEGIIEIRKPVEEKKPKLFSIKEVLIMGVATAIDALAVGVSLHAGLSTSVTIWLHVSIICVITFAISLAGLFLGKQILKLLKGKTEITVIIGGCILILLAVWVIVSHYAGL